MKIFVFLWIVISHTCLNFQNNNPDIEFISLEIKNNSNNRNHFYVIGPKLDGTKFSYGFPMMPNTKRKENWSIVTKVYKQNTLEFKSLLVVISENDKNKVVNLFN